MPEQPLMVDGHMNLGHTQDVPMPERFTAPDNGSTVPQQMGENFAQDADNAPLHNYTDYDAPRSATRD